MNLPNASEWLFLQIIIFSAEILQNIKKDPDHPPPAGYIVIWPAAFIIRTNMACPTICKKFICKAENESHH